MKRTIYDITMTISPEIPVYPGDPTVKIEEISSIEKGDQVNLSSIQMGVHTGTHIDAPKHFFDNGLTVDQLPWEYLIGTAKVIEVKEKATITLADLEKYQIHQKEIILLKTRNSALLTRKEFITDYTYLTPEAIHYLAEIGIRTLGFDYLSLDQYANHEFNAHYTLLGKNIVLIEGLNLARVNPGEYQMIALPLKILNSNGSPARVILIA